LGGQVPIHLAVAPSPNDPLRIMVLGDSVMHDASFGITAALGATGEATVATRTIDGFGLVNAGVLLRGFGTGTWAVLTASLVGRPVGILVAVGIAVAAGSEDKTDLLERSGFPRNGSCGLIGKSLDHQGMRWVDVIMMNGELRTSSPGLSNRMPQSLALEEIEIESQRQNKDLALALARNRGRQRIDGR